MIAKFFVSSLIAIGIIWSQPEPPKETGSLHLEVPPGSEDSVVVKVGRALLILCPSPDATAIDATIQVDSSEHKYVINGGGGLGSIKKIVATAQGNYWAIGLESLSKKQDEYEYRFLFNWIPPDNPRIGLPRISPVLMRAPIAERFNVMSVSVLEGDTVSLTLQKLVRKKGPATHADIVTHTFVNPCPTGFEETIGATTNHYQGTLPFTGKAIPRKPKPTSQRS